MSLSEHGDGRSIHDAPTAADLVAVVAELLHDRVLGALEGELRWQVRIAANVLEVVARELGEDPAVAADLRERLRLLGFADEAALSAAIRSGTPTQDDPAVRAYVTESVRARLQVSKPSALGPD